MVFALFPVDLSEGGISIRKVRAHLHNLQAFIVTSSMSLSSAGTFICSKKIGISTALCVLTGCERLRTKFVPGGRGLGLCDANPCESLKGLCVLGISS
jgi:hypothetical protein